MKNTTNIRKWNPSHGSTSSGGDGTCDSICFPNVVFPMEWIRSFLTKRFTESREHLVDCVPHLVQWFPLKTSATVNQSAKFVGLYPRDIIRMETMKGYLVGICAGRFFDGRFYTTGFDSHLNDKEIEKQTMCEGFVASSK